MSDPSGIFPDLLAAATSALAAFVAFSLVDPAPPRQRRRRWLRRLGSALFLVLAALAFALPRWDQAGVAPGPAPWLGLGLLVLGSIAAAVLVDQRRRSDMFHASGALAFSVPVTLGQALLLGAPGDGGLGGAPLWVAGLYLSVAASAGFISVAHFRRRRSGGPLQLGVAAALLLAGGLLCQRFVLAEQGLSGAVQPGPLTLALLLALIGVTGFLARRRWRTEQDASSGLRRSSRADAVSGLPVVEVVAESFVRVQRLAVASRSQCAVLVLEFGALERILSTQGKAVRDRLYATAAWRLRSARRDEELIGALGDQRFLMVLRVQDADEAIARVRQLVGMFEQPLGDGPDRVRLRPSAGVSIWPAHGDEFPRLLANALVALERCPPGGLQLFHAIQRAENEQRLQVEHSLIHAIRAGEIGLVMQPIIDTQSGDVRLVELLARWNHPQLGPISPTQFIVVAEGSGAIAEFDRWLLREALATTKWLDAAGFPSIRVALNCSPMNLVDPDFLDDLERSVLDSGIDPWRLEIEVTEAALAEGKRTVIDSLVRLRSLGLGLTIDDFGIGHSSLARLRDLPVDGLKIDQSFVRDMDHPKGEFLISGIVGLAQGLGKTVVAEGVETRAQRETLTRIGCEYLQGFLIARPLSWRALLDFLGVDADDAPPGRPAALAEHNDPHGH